ncbi:MAG: HEAT repeat domain-containing protein [Planctomycetota bacterium]
MRWNTGAAVLCLAAAAYAGETIIAELEWEPGFVGTIHARYYRLSSERPQDLKVPEGIAAPQFAEFLLLGARVPVVVDRAKNRLFVDANQNRDLTDDPERRWSVSRDMHVVHEVVRVPFGDELVPVAFDIRQRLGQTDRIFLYTKIHRLGHVVLNGRLRRVALVDGNGDLRFDDPKFDHFFLDVDGDGELQTRSDAHEKLQLGKPFRIGNVGYAARIDEPSGSKLHFESVRPPAQRPWYFPRWAPREKRPAVEKPKEPLTDVVAAYDAATDDHERVKQLKRVGPYGTAEAFKFLHKVYKSNAGSTVRKWAVDQMDYRGFSPFSKEIAAIVRDSNAMQSCRNMAMVALHRHDAKKRVAAYRVALEYAVEKKSKVPAEFATRYLAEHGGKAARAIIVNAYGDAADFDVRLVILKQCLRRDPDGPPLKLIELAIKDFESAMRELGFEALWYVDPLRARKEALRRVPLREDEFGYVGKQFVRILARAGDKKAVEAVIKICDGDQRRVGAAVRELRLLRSDAARAALVRGLTSKQAHTRLLCARALASMSAEGIVPAVAGATKRETDPDALESMIDVLGALRDPKSIPALLKVAKSDSQGRPAAVAALARIGYDDPRVRAFFLKLLRSKHWRNRIYALRAVAAIGDTGQVGAVIAQLADSRWQVRSACIDTLRALAQKHAILPLIERLDVESRRRVRFEILKALFRLTAKDFGVKSEPWRSWWAASGDEHSVPEIPPKAKVSNYGTVAQFYGIPVHTDRVVFVIDASGSMRTLDAKEREMSRIDVAKKSLLAAVARLGESAKFNVVFFSDKPSPWKNSMVGAKPSSKDALAKHLGGIEPKGETNLYDALEFALALKEVDTVVVLSDGAPSAGKYVNRVEVRRAVARLNRARRIQIHSISIGKNSRLLRELTADSGGIYYRR